jgi:hypothetical protein
MRNPAAAVVFVTITTAFAFAIGIPAAAQADDPAPCTNGQVTVSAGQTQSGMGHRAVTLTFSLAAGAQPCTLTGYPGVDSGAGGPLVHAERTLSGYMGGVRADSSPTVTITPWQPAQAVVEGDTASENGSDEKCPSYRDLQVTPPDTTDTVTVPAGIDGACHFQIHPIGSYM